MESTRTTHRPILPGLAWAAVVAGLLLAQWPALSHAEERATIITLSYVRGYSNWGPTNAHGTAQLWPGEGVVTLQLHDLPPLPNGAKYMSWIVNTSTGDALLLGSFNATQAGDAIQDVIFSQAMPPHANAIVVTIMNPGDPASLPGPERTVAGYFHPTAGPVIVRPATGHARTVPGSAPRRNGAHGRTLGFGVRHGSHPTRHPGVGVITPRARGHGQRSGTHTTPHPIVRELPHTGGGPFARCRPGRRHTPCRNEPSAVSYQLFT